jgi:drug/metabolite transporter (DMT)-like permease
VSRAEALDPHGEPCATPVVDPDSVPQGAAPPSRLLIALALVTLYFIWGSTYLGIRIALRGYPPLFFPGLRFAAAGAALLGIMRLRGAPLPTPRQWFNATLIGFLLLGVGNGGVVLAERSVGSGLAATAVATVPLWAALFGLFWGHRPTLLQWLGLGVGFAGIVFLNLRSDLSAETGAALLLAAAPLSWAFGSVLSRRLDMPAGLMNPAAQMLTAGVLFLVGSAAAGERWQFHTAPAPMAALVYLTVFGSMVAYSAYIYLVHNASPALATSYAYVNPVVAVVLGVLLGGESFASDSLTAIGLVLAGVALIVIFNPRRSH